MMVRGFSYFEIFSLPISYFYFLDEMDWFEPLLESAPVSPSSESLVSTNLPHDLLDDQESNSHLQDHNYALSPYDECFGSSNKASYPAEFLEGATAMLSPASSASTGFFNSQRETRDERKARELNLPFSVWDIIDLPIDGFNELLTRHTLTEDQLSLCRDIRRRGKNKASTNLGVIFSCIVICFPLFS